MTDRTDRTSGHHTRRRFLEVAGAGIAVLAAGGAAAEKKAKKAKKDKQRPPARKLPLELGLASYTLRKFPLDQALQMTRRVGLVFICLKSFHLPLEATADQIAEAAAKVKKAGLVLYGGGVISMGNEAEVNRAFDYAKAAGMKTIVAAPRPEVLPLLNRKVQEYGIQVAIHNHGPGDKTYPTPQSVYEKVRELDPRIGLCIDVGHTVRIGADPVADAEKYADRLLDVHVKDVSAAAPQGDTVEIGRGVIDIPRFLKTLLRIRYRGIVAFEYEKDEADPLPGLAESIGYCRGVLAAL
jgi:sugar phosphate isomerase/epimerase